VNAPAEVGARIGSEHLVTAWSSRDLFAALLIVFVWGMNFVAMKFSLAYFTPFELGVARYLFAAFPLVLLVRPPRVALRFVLLYGVLQGVGQFGLLFTAIKFGMSSALASVLMQTQVFFTALFGVLLLRERLAPALRAGLALAALALACFSMTYLLGPANSGWLSFILNLAAASMWAASNIVARLAQRSSPGYDALAFIVWGSLVPIGPFMMLSLLFDPASSRGAWHQAPLSTWAAVAYLGWMATVLAYGMWTWLLKRHAASRVAPFSLGVPVVGLAAGMLLMGETIDLWQGIGIAVVFAALICVLLGPRLMKLSARLQS
jgi:O-acetylserine/cysteine efflux transporter